jgi:hypothetical protein
LLGSIATFFHFEGKIAIWVKLLVGGVKCSFAILLQIQGIIGIFYI